MNRRNIPPLLLFISMFIFSSCSNHLLDMFENNETTVNNGNGNEQEKSDFPDISQLTSSGHFFTVEADNIGLKITFDPSFTGSKNEDLAIEVYKYDTKYNLEPFFIDLYDYVDDQGNLNNYVVYYHFSESNQLYALRLKGPRPNAPYLNDWAKCTATAGYKLTDYVYLENLEDLSLDITYTPPTNLDTGNPPQGHSASVKLTSKFNNKDELFHSDKITTKNNGGIYRAAFEAHLFFYENSWNTCDWGGMRWMQFLGAGNYSYNADALFQQFKTSMPLDNLHTNRIDYGKNHNKYMGEFYIIFWIGETRYQNKPTFSEIKTIQF